LEARGSTRERKRVRKSLGLHCSSLQPPEYLRRSHDHLTITQRGPFDCLVLYLPEVPQSTTAPPSPSSKVKRQISTSRRITNTVVKLIAAEISQPLDAANKGDRHRRSSPLFVPQVISTRYHPLLPCTRLYPHIGPRSIDPSAPATNHSRPLIAATSSAISPLSASLTQTLVPPLLHAYSHHISAAFVHTLSKVLYRHSLEDLAPITEAAHSR
jgi:hypothetical protein